MIHFDSVSLIYDASSPALDNLSFQIETGSFTFLTGHSGAGKSSLLRLIARLERPTSGHIDVGGIDYSRLRPSREPALRRQMGVIFQDNRLLNDRNLFDNVALPLIIGGYSYKDILTRVSAALQRVGLEHAANMRPASLSGGEQQRAGIARALVARPRLLLADEPTGNLDAAMSEDIMKLLLQFHRSGVTVVVATHDTELLSNHRFPILQLAAGRRVSSDSRRTRSRATANRESHV